MNQIGLVANARGSWPSQPEIAALNPAGLRTIVYSNDELDTALRGVPQGVKIVALLNSEHEDVGSNYENWAGAVGRFAARFKGRVHAVECGNELDLLGAPPELGARLVREADSTLRDADILTLMGSVAGSDWQNWLSQACNLSRGWYDGVCLHPYGQRPDGFAQPGWMFGDLRNAITSAHDRAQASVWLTEWGVKIGDAGGIGGQAEYLGRGVETIRALGPDVVPFAAYFAWCDAVGGPSERGNAAFGLRDELMRTRPAWDAFAAANAVKEAPPVAISVWGGSPPPNAIFQLGFLTWANREPTLLGQPHDAAEFGVATGISQQRTTRGLLTWADLKSGQVTTFLDATNGKRYAWDGVRSTEVKAR